MIYRNVVEHAVTEALTRIYRHDAGESPSRSPPKIPMNRSGSEPLSREGWSFQLPGHV